MMTSAVPPSVFLHVCCSALLSFSFFFFFFLFLASFLVLPASILSTLSLPPLIAMETSPLTIESHSSSTVCTHQNTTTSPI
ncbi:hypothetical protein RchiOBHm_Chr2g0125301 [Rosa chinensis]|uniref:Uncharacterized protein n=1 Tax=Rosa chinensis TaxID=74649 RepID=A0A2P6RTK8_ROSCH|nr:hypothetical protein RchiOBHm_Chr2g0125301 [Rosa chinensis]